MFFVQNRNNTVLTRTQCGVNVIKKHIERSQTPSVGRQHYITTRSCFKYKKYLLNKSNSVRQKYNINKLVFINLQNKYNATILHTHTMSKQ